MRAVRNVVFLLLIACSGLFAQYQDAQDEEVSEFPMHSDQEIRSRLEQIVNKVVSPRFDAVVRSYVYTYTILKREKTEAMLGKMVMYFPLFEKLFEEHDMPSDLKYLSITESALNPNARSRAGAVGLWQFMPYTGIEYGLTNNYYLDLRKDPEKSTLAAIRFLKRLYNQYGNWELALAAYNGGPGRVNRAIKRGRSKNYWSIRKYLPRETRNYVPAYIAATYIAHFYEEHDLVPVYPDVDLQLTESTTVYEGISFTEISEITDVPVYIIEILNPAYKRNFIPSSTRGHSLVLPMTQMALFKDSFKKPDDDQRHTTAGGNIPAPKTTRGEHSDAIIDHYIVEHGDSLSTLAKAFFCTEKDIMIWNRLTSRQLRKGQALRIYLPQTPPMPSTPSHQLQSLCITPDCKATYQLNVKPPDLSSAQVSFAKFSSKGKLRKRDYKFVYHKIRPGQSLIEIAEKYEVTIDDLLQFNEIRSPELLKAGMKIKVKKK